MIFQPTRSALLVSFLAMASAGALVACSDDSEAGGGGGHGGEASASGGSGGGGGNTYCVDSDGDGYGNPDICITAESAPDGFVDNSDDPNDLNADVGPDAKEVCDGLDNNGDGTVDAGPCDTNATCQGEGKDIACVCGDGFEGSGAKCDPIPWDMVDAGGRRIYNASQTSAHSCGIRGGQLYCWGANGHGQLGSEGSGTASPRRVGASDGWEDVSAGGAFTCGIDDGALYCWGHNTDGGKYEARTFGILGLGEDFDAVESVGEPTQVGAATDWVEVNAGTHYACGVRESGDARIAYCWGKDASGAGNLGDGTTESRNVPTLVVGDHTDWVSVGAGLRLNSCGLRSYDLGMGMGGAAAAAPEMTMWCWGNDFGNIDVGESPVRYGNAADWLLFDVGAWGGCGLRGPADAAQLYCGGTNSHRTRGAGGGGSMNQVGTDVGWQDVDMGQGFACGVRGGDAYCWGRAVDGEMGLETLPASCDYNHNGHTDCDEPTLVDDKRTYTQISSGTGQTCAVTDKGKLFCWGASTFGEAGSLSARTTPIEIK